jgi:hypothetical protein
MAHISRRSFHPEDHPCHKGDGDDCQGSSEYFFTMWTEFVGSKTEDRSETKAQQESQGHASPEGGAKVSAIGFHQIGHENAYDERGFETLTEGDNEGAQHSPNLEGEE